MTHSFLMIGQSNMAGRGFLEEVPPIYDEKIKMLRNGRWQVMTEPLNYDRSTAGVGLAASFASAWRLFHNQEDDIALIPCADGGTSLDDWDIEGSLFENTVLQAKAAQKISTLQGILWHQGENDSLGNRHIQYQQKLTRIIEQLRKELNIPHIPLIIGGLGNFLGNGIYGKYFNEHHQINEALMQFTEANENTYFVSSDGLTANPDGVHFDAASQRKFGIRYFEAFHDKKNIPEALVHETDTLDTIYQRPLTKNEKMGILQHQFGLGKISVQEFGLQASAIQ
ncbi:lysophospholipase L1-like esterase [Chryseobacterium sp. 52]|uniref:sialate O-acetylesterase n=1 Tax=Chryseobacterium sp. 52 TaxID=2035213 RepID=UPI000C19C468|nr:sialate O-acetylesterase [Chryseobacterium sp. 52]PIF47514.1 lysophospholipase L1-like esterase [Chryseobacterium sp. 52]